MVVQCPTEYQTLVYYFMRPAKARVLYGYFENNTMRVVTTKAHNFDVPTHCEMMNSLAQWAFPCLHYYTETVGSLTAIEECSQDGS